MKTVIDKIVIAWNEISADTIRKSWKKLVPLPTLESSPTTEQNPPVSALQNDFPKVAEFLADFQQMGQSLTEQDVEDWLDSDRNDLGYEHLDSDGIVNHATGELSGEQDSIEECDDDGPSEIPTEESIHVISHQEAMDMFDKCLT